ncbi:alpha/beta hydrolase [Tessaracoccus lubricantis]|uniref:Alpha/beta hydrolase n=1 Tax=Tessaracoccus lubricantis TaxID=545543 RepID=A0ABP9FH90_9ACTN
MDIILIPGLWLDGGSWERVTPHLLKAGHRVTALTPPGHDGGDPRHVTYGDLVAAIVTEIDNAGGPALMVGHSAACAAAWAATDRRPGRVCSVMLVGGFPIPDGMALLDGFEATDDGVLPFPGWQPFDGPDVADLSDGDRAWLEGHMSPAPADYALGTQSLGNPERYGVRVVMVCPEYGQAEVQQWVTQGFHPVAELPRIKEVAYVDLASGHWPQASQPERLAAVILTEAGGGR